MAFENVDKKQSFKKLTELAVGEALTGYLLAITDSRIEGAKNLVMRIGGDEVVVGAAGNIKYLIKDNKLSLNVNTRITRQEDTKIKGKTATRFAVEQDMSDTIAGASPAAMQAAAATSTTSVADKLKSLRG